MLQAEYERGTKDSDVLETAELDVASVGQLLAIAGPGSPIHQRRRMYVEMVAGGLPLLPQQPHWRRVASLDGSLRNIRVEVLAVVDVVVSELKRLSSNDLADIDAMIERELVDHRELVERFRLAVDFHGMDARAEDLPRSVANLHRIERDLFGVEESAIDLPSWV
jgi:hypothetical protein